MILVRTDHPCLRVGHHRWYQSHYGYNTSRTILFLKTYGEDMLRCPYMDYSSLNRWQANRDLLSVTMHRRQGKKVCILPSGDLNPRPVPSRWGLLEDSPYHAVGAAVHRATSYDHAPRACEDLEISCGHLRKTWIRSCNICSAVHTTLNAWGPLGG
jgi:hypothetical protein